MFRPTTRMLAGALFVAALLVGVLAPTTVAAQADVSTRCVTFSGDVADLSPEDVMDAIAAGTITIEQVADPAGCATTAPIPPPSIPAFSPRSDFIEPGDLAVCSLVTDAEVEAIFHRRLLFGSSYGQESGGVHSCVYDFDHDPMVLASIALYSGADAEPGGWTCGDPVDGVGDEAYWLEDTLWVAAGDQSIAVTVIIENSEVDPLTAAQEIARLALPALD